MQANLLKEWGLPLKPTWFRWLLIILLVAGIVLRFVNLDRKVYWGDEVFTSIRISGYTQAEVVQETFTGQVLSVADLQTYQRPSPDKTLGDALNALATHPEHSPLYYLMARFWVQSFGSSVATIRSLSALISLLALPCVYWLCLELFESPLTGWVAMTLLAISPFHLLYAQEAREYSLWTVTILLMSAAFLSAIRQQTSKSWAIYALTVALGLYAHLFSGLVAIAHGLYLLMMAGWRSRKTLAYMLSSIAGLVAFLPWLWIVIANLNELHDNTAHLQSNQARLVLIWLLNLSRVFIDFNHGSGVENPILYITLILTAYSLYFLCRQTLPKIWLFILTLIGVTGLALILPDLILGGQRSAIARYPIACYLGIELTVAYLFAMQISKAENNQTTRNRWRNGFVTLAAIGLISGIISAPMQMWWNKSYKSIGNPEVAAIVNSANQPLLISDSTVDRVVSLSYLLDADTQLQLVTDLNALNIPEQFSEVFIYLPSAALQQKLAANPTVQLAPAYKTLLWKLSRR